MDEIDWECAPLGTHRYISGDSKHSAKWLRAEYYSRHGCLVWDVKDGDSWVNISDEEWKDMHEKHDRITLKPPIPLDVIAMKKDIKRMVEDSDYSILECQAEILYERGYRRIAQ